MAEYLERETAVMRLMQDGCSAKNVQTIMALPAVDVAPVVHSYWEHKITGDEKNIGVCHNCKYPVSWFWGRSNYCPNCGARMDGAE